MLKKTFIDPDRELQFLNGLLKYLNEYNIINDDDRLLRNLEIRFDYIQLKKEGRLVKDIIQTLADKYFLSVKSIEKIVYGGIEKKIFLLQLNPFSFTILNKNRSID